MQNYEMKKGLLSFVVACYRSEKTIELVINEVIAKVKEKPEYSYEIIAVNDCSPDNVYSILKNISTKDKNIKVIDLARNMGKHAALMAGFSHVSGEIIICLDDDNQCPIDRLWDLIQPLKRDCDISIARYNKKKQNILKNVGSFANSLMAEILLNKPKNLQLSNYFACKRFIIDEILSYKSPFPYIDGLLLRTTQRIENVDMEEREREVGKSGYTFRKSLSLWLNGFTAFSVKPLRLATFLGTIISLVGFVFLIYIIIDKIIRPEVLAGYTSLMAVLLFIGGIIMIMLGLIGEYVGRSYICLNNSPQYVIRERINCETTQKAKN